ncbi:run domain Beclin-1-interacting and cysteine-rich domain-containing protein [Onthophagus taurus]|uniref:run domain Beclin-1-interacting and cysteine-rich domain-containing protein n=1 Tax=Onthophagus taurus TaxID=166361 RepID=UPI0039BDFB4E
MSNDNGRFVIKYQQLLRDLKTTIEGLLVSQVPNLWSIYGGLNRLHVDVEKIFKHGCKTSTENQISGYYHFVQGLEWLYPDSSKSTLVVDCEYKSHFPQHIKNDKASIWLYRSLENHSLSQKLSWLLSDKTHLLACYQSSAFLCQPKYSEAILICLRAVERNELTLLSEIDPCLFLHKETVQVYERRHRRCSSLPDTRFKNILIKPSKTLKEENPVHKKFQISIFKAWSSTPNLGPTKTNVIEAKSHTNPSTPVNHSRKISISSLKSPVLLENDRLSIRSVEIDQLTSIKKESNLKLRPVIINNEDIIEHTPPSTSQQQNINGVQDLKSPLKGRFAKSPDLGFLNALAGEKDFKHKPKKTFIEDGGMSILPTATGYFPRPKKGQTLTSFLTSSQFSRANAELDRENAHFSISEAMIAVIEQIRCGRSLKLIDEADESDEEINNLKQRIRLRRKEKQEEKQKRLLLNSLVSEKSDLNPTETSPYSSSPATNSLSSGGGVEDMDIDEVNDWLLEKEGLSMSMASLYSEADVLKKPRGAPDGASDIMSAEGVALSLISRFNEKQLPRASELEWIVSEEDAPQALLPLPKTWLDDSQDVSTISLRGTQDWAPPRPQIIFTLHPAPIRKQLMAKQDYRCAGCGMRVAPQYASKFRYCHYLGRYFCTGCHTNQVSIIPARIIQKWDFARYPVSNFSYRLIEQMYVDPLFRVFEYNKNIAKRSANLATCRTYRIGLHYMRDFILNCRFAETIQDYLNCERTFLFNDPELFSLEDLLSVRSGEMKSHLRCVIEMCWRHILECQLCSARGFICEICKDPKVIFPWQQRTVSRCGKCGTCFHSICWTIDTPCVRCARINKRKTSLQDN